MQTNFKRWPSFAEFLAALLIAARLAAPAAAQAPVTREMHASLSGQLRMVQLRVMSGRISATGPVSHQNLTSNYMGNQRRERLSVDFAGGTPNITYERSTAAETLMWVVERGHQVTVQLTPRSTTDHATINFHQPSDGPLTLDVTTGERSVQYRAPTLWQLLLYEPEVCELYLLPLLNVLRPGWRLAEQAQEIEAALCRADSGRALADHGQWQRFVKLLADDRYVARERAEQQLVALGPVILPYLRGREQTSLDAEQAFRIRRIIRTLSADGDEDSPERVLFTLVADARVWYALLGRADVEVRRVASDRLGQILGNAIDFHADAASEQRVHELETLAERYPELKNP